MHSFTRTNLDLLWLGNRALRCLHILVDLIVIVLLLLYELQQHSIYKVVLLL